MKFDSDVIERLVPEQLTVVQMPGFRLVEGTVWPCGESGFGWGLRDSIYEELLQQHENTDFLFEPWIHVPCEARLTGVSDEFYADYVHFPQVEAAGSGDVDIRLLVDQEKFDCIVTDFRSMDGYLYDIAGKPAYRSFAIRLPEGYGYAVKGLDKILRQTYTGARNVRRKNYGEGKIRIGSLQVNPVPYYNRDSSGNLELAFNFYPADYKQFQQIRDADVKDATRDYTTEILGILNISSNDKDHWDK